MEDGVRELREFTRSLPPEGAGLFGFPFPWAMPGDAHGYYGIALSARRTGAAMELEDEDEDEDDYLWRNLFPKFFQFVGAEVGEDPAVHVNHRGQSLAGEADHFGVGPGIGDDVERFVGNAVFVQPVHGFMAPGTVGLDEKADFHVR
jgi:hypothetical protein